MSSSINWKTHISDIMAHFNKDAIHFLMQMDLDRYQLILTFSPFNSVNEVLINFKKKQPTIKWASYVCDPFLNPLEKSWIRNTGAFFLEKKIADNSDLIIFNSETMREDFLKRNNKKNKTDTIPHFFCSDLYPKRLKKKNEKLKIRFVGTLFGKRTPESFFAALSSLLQKNKNLSEKISVELIGFIEAKMLQTGAFLKLPSQMVSCIDKVTYIESLEYMYDADLLLLIEADVKLNLFFPSKIIDYLGADTPIIALSSPGHLNDVLKRLGCWLARPNNVTEIELALANGINYVLEKSHTSSWCDDEYRQSFSFEKMSQDFENSILRIM
jgi:glycosyltransferase involved in cell wall biosynthesis